MAHEVKRRTGVRRDGSLGRGRQARQPALCMHSQEKTNASDSPMLLQATLISSNWNPLPQTVLRGGGGGRRGAINALPGLQAMQAVGSTEAASGRQTVGMA